jgi:hypothetical protein
MSASLWPKAKRLAISRTISGASTMISDDVSLILSLKDHAEDCLIELHECAEADREMKAYWRSMYLRAVLAFIEGTVGGLSLQAYGGRQRSGVTLSEKEINMLESYFDFAAGRVTRTSLSETQILADIELAFFAFARVNYSAYVLPIHEGGWLLIKEIAVMRTRNRNLERDELDVYPENVDVLMHGMEWFVGCLIDLLKSSEEALAEVTADAQVDDHELIM